MGHAAVERCRVLTGCTDEEGMVRRACLGPAMKRAHMLVAGWMEAAGLDVRVDPVGNLIGRVGDPKGRPLAIGSHLDTVRDAGPFDGILGVMLGIAVVEHFRSRGQALPVPIEVLGFTGEEAARFPLPYLGSLAMVGGLPEDALRLCDPQGTTLEQAIADFGGDPGRLFEPAWSEANRPLAYLELHIEQGPLLESRGLPLGVVSGLVGQRWFRLSFEGRAGHAGTTPMELRRDAAPAAAELVLVAESMARSTPGLLATTGELRSSPGAINVIAGRVTVSLDVRHGDGAALQSAADALLAEARSIAARRGLDVKVEALAESAPSPCDPGLRALLAEAVEAAGVTPTELVSGAGHDARAMARLTPSCMLFLRSPGGLSHHPEEDVDADDVALALDAAVRFVDKLAHAPR
ncbi:MAG: allantoate amidohydrolase [Deltaproteobacteria bacterium]|nr:allantoate amidohydrolase [Deltaproteobacteria bacterium]